jgi:hypothetical protein
MKNFFIHLFILTVFFVNTTQAQVVDSINVRLTWESLDSVTWVFSTQNIDSLSTGLLKAQFIRTWVNNSWENQWLYEHTYSTVADTTTYFQWNGQWDNYYQFINIHNAQGLDTMIIWQGWLSGSWIFADRYERTYNADSTIATEIHSYWNTTTSQWDLYEFATWNRDSTGLDTAITTDRYNAGNWEPFKRESFTYDSAGNEIYVEGNYWDDTDSIYWLTYYHGSWMYDSLGRVIFTSSGDIPGGHGHDYYFYNQDNSYSEVWSYYDSHAGDETWYHTHYYSGLTNNVYAFLPDDYPICQSDVIPIGGFAFGGQQPLTYSWSPAAGLSSDTVENPYVSTDTTTTYILTVTDANNLTASDTINIIINSVFDSLVTTPASCAGCTDGQIQIYAGSINNLTITPDPGATIQGNVISNVPPGIYSVCMVNQDGCTACEIDTVEFNVGIKQTPFSEFYITTNPYSEFTELHCNSSSKNLRLEIYDELGENVSEIKIDSPSTTIHRGNLRSGIYYGVVWGDKVLGRVRLVVME